MTSRLRLPAAVMATLGVVLGAGCIGGDDDDEDPERRTSHDDRGRVGPARTIGPGGAQ